MSGPTSGTHDRHITQREGVDHVAQPRGLHPRRGGAAHDAGPAGLPRSAAAHACAAGSCAATGGSRWPPDGGGNTPPAVGVIRQDGGHGRRPSRADLRTRPRTRRAGLGTGTRSRRRDRRRVRAVGRRRRHRQDPCRHRAGRDRPHRRTPGAGRPLSRPRRQRHAVPAVRRGVVRARPGRARRGAQASPALAGLIASPDADDGGERADILSGVALASTASPRDQPLLLVVEDAHWADASTRHLLQFVLARRFSNPVSLVVSYRSDDLHRRHPLRAAVAEWARLPGVRRLELEPLDDSAVGAILRSREATRLERPRGVHHHPPRSRQRLLRRGAARRRPRRGCAAREPRRPRARASRPPHRRRPAGRRRRRRAPAVRPPMP